MFRNNRVLLDAIDKEKKGQDYRYSAHDGKVLKCLFREMNKHLGTRVRYLCEMVFYAIKGSGPFIEKYIREFDSSAVQAYLLPNLLLDKLENTDRLVLDLYRQFQQSSEYISPPGKPSPAHIHVRIDNAFRELKPKRLRKELTEIVLHPRDAHYLPLTVNMLASWRVPEIKELLISFLDDSTVRAETVGLPEPEDSVKYYPSLDYIKSQLRFTAIQGLKYYPTEDVVKLIRSFAEHEDKDISTCAKKTLAYYEKKGVIL